MSSSRSSRAPADEIISADVLFACPSEEDDRSAKGLTPRQLILCRLLLEGCNTPTIAREMGIRPRTVKGHLHQLFLAFQVTGCVQLAVKLYGQRFVLGIEEEEREHNDTRKQSVS